MESVPEVSGTFSPDTLYVGVPDEVVMVIGIVMG
jgi:hypothetical protein